MKVKIFLLLICIVSNITSAQLIEPVRYKVFERHIEDCKKGTEEIILYADGSFHVSSCIGNIAVQYNGGWWINDSLLVLQPSLNCDAPRLLKTNEFQDKNDNGITVEVYNEKGRLLYYGKLNDKNQIETIRSDGCIISEVKESVFFRYFRFIIKGKGFHAVKTKKKNNKIEIMILEPSTSSDIYLGKEIIPLNSLIEISLE